MMELKALTAVSAICFKVTMFSLQTGYKCMSSRFSSSYTAWGCTDFADYGAHLGGDALATFPWKEDSARHKGGNFYYDQVRSTTKKREPI